MARTHQNGQRSRVRIWTRDGATSTIFESFERLLEAPNWAPDGALILNGDGLLWELASDGTSGLLRIDTGHLDNLNNDHVLSPDGALIYASADDGHIWEIPRQGGTPRQVTSDPNALHFLHGVSPDGLSLAYVRIPLDNSRLSPAVHVIGVDGVKDRSVTDGLHAADGPEWSPDGKWLLFNTEAFAANAQIARAPRGGRDVQQLTFDERVNWFPHIAPTNDIAVYLSYPPGTEGHPADLPVQLRVVHTGDWTTPLHAINLFGGQGTINVSSWSPDGRAFAFVDYPLH